MRPLGRGLYLLKRLKPYMGNFGPKKLLTRLLNLTFLFVVKTCSRDLHVYSVVTPSFVAKNDVFAVKFRVHFHVFHTVVKSNLRHHIL